MKRPLLVPLFALLLFLVSPLAADETCRYLIRFEPGISQEQAESVLKRHSLRLLHIYTTLSKASGSLIVSAESSICTAESERRLADDPSIASLQREGQKKPLLQTEHQKGGEAPLFSALSALLTLGTLVYISSLGF
ncbi:hypothetical protein [Hydrogenimonas sp.]